MATTVTFSASRFGSLPAVRCQRRCEQNLSHPVNDRFAITPMIAGPD